MSARSCWRSDDQLMSGRTLVAPRIFGVGQLLQGPADRGASSACTLERREYDIMKGETRTPEFLRDVNANGRIPVLQVGDRFIPESNAACYYLADGVEPDPDRPVRSCRHAALDVLGAV